MTDQFNDDEEIILSELPDDELILQMHDDIYDGLAEEIAEGTRILLERGWDASRVLEKALVGGMAAVGVDFRDGILFVPEVLMSANAMKAGMSLLKPILSAVGSKPIGKVVVGTVKGDIHDIGKNLVCMMLEGAGFEVTDAGAVLQLGPDLHGHFLRELEEAATVVAGRGYPTVLACAPGMRPALGRLVRDAAPGTTVISYQEIGDHLQVDLIATIDMPALTTPQREEHDDRYAGIS